MIQESYTDAFMEWIRANQERLNVDHISVRLPEEKKGNGTYADFFAESGEATVEIWDYGFSEFHVLDPQTQQVSVTHFEFQQKSEMYSALDDLVNRMTPAMAI